MTSYYRLLKGTGQRIGKDTLFEYLAHLEDVNFIKMVPLFGYSLKRQAVNLIKSYPKSAEDYGREPVGESVPCAGV
jgi:predicted AAA+ superfamily ATPase